MNKSAVVWGIDSYFSLQSYCTKKPKHSSGEAANRDKGGRKPEKEK